MAKRRERRQWALSASIMVCLISAASALDIGGVHVGGVGGNGNTGNKGRQSSPSRSPSTVRTATAAAGVSLDVGVLINKRKARARVGVNTTSPVPDDDRDRQREVPKTPKDILDLGEPSVHLLVGNLSEEDQFALKKKCRDVLANPSWFDASLVALCQIIVPR